MTKMAKDHLWPIFFGSILGGTKLSIFKLICYLVAIMFCVMEMLQELRTDNTGQKYRKVKIGGAVLGTVCFLILLIDECFNL